LFPSADTRRRVLTAVAAAGTALVLISAGASRPPDPGRLAQTAALPSAETPAFRLRMRALWRGVTTGSFSAALPAFFPRGAYLQVKQIGDPGGDYRRRLLVFYRRDLEAAHRLVAGGAAQARLLYVSVPRQWSWIRPGACFNRIGYWHAPGARMVYRQAGRIRSFGIYSLISWRGEWYVVHLAVYDQPGTVFAPAVGVGAYGPPGGC
jgi:hypothetical protein